MRSFSAKNKFGLWVMSQINGFNYHKYFRRRAVLVDANNKIPIIVKLYYLYYCKRAEISFQSSLGTNLNGGSTFKMPPPYMPYGLNGIIIGSGWEIGKGRVIYHQVTIAGGTTGFISNNVEIGAGAKILPDLKIGSNVRIGANSIVIEDVPDNSTVVMQKPRIIIRQ